MGKSSSYVKNSAYFIKEISKAPIHFNQMITLDVINLFTRVPTDETLTVVWDELAADPSREERTCIPIDNLLLSFCVKTTYYGDWHIWTRRIGYWIAVVASID